ncbi:hypothetical protein HanXRQr2_Chr07g0308221 [Helianthus annuus]|uniref:Uncharacterized protein n=1 Tax=Helianthus annuus TaxID=4232 RepID=A0A9K3NGV8_HELAN|nr:hypothetical protein HanXRQr2_Chr07g0308221 [Helianthus annuus]
MYKIFKLTEDPMQTHLYPTNLKNERKKKTSFFFFFLCRNSNTKDQIISHFSTIFGPLYIAATTDKLAGLSISSSHAWSSIFSPSGNFLSSTV